MAVVYFSHHVPLGRQHLGPSIPVVGLEPAFTLLFPLAVQSLHPCGITTSDNPADSSAAVTIQRLEDPSFGFLTPRRCHLWVDFDFLNACGHNSLIGAGRREVKQLG